MLTSIISKGFPSEGKVSEVKVMKKVTKELKELKSIVSESRKENFLTFSTLSFIFCLYFYSTSFTICFTFSGMNGTDPGLE